MDIQDKIIALLHGDVRSDDQVAELMHSLANSAESRFFFLEQIILARRIDQIVESIDPPMNSMQMILNEMDKYEEMSKRKKPIYRASALKAKLTSAAILVLLGIGIGYLLFTKDDYVVSSTQDRSNRPLSQKRSQDSRMEVNSQIKSTREGRERILQAKASNFDKEVESRAANNEIAKNGELARVISPNGGELFVLGSVIPLSWQLRDSNSAATVEFSINGGIDWTTLAENVKGGKYLWKIDSNYTGSKCLLRVNSAQDLDLTPQTILQAYQDGGNSVAISPDARMLVTAAADSLIMWDLQTKRRIAIMSGHKRAIILVRFSPDGRRLVTGSIDSTAIIWDVATHKPEHILYGKRGRIWPADFSPDGMRVATGNDDGSITVWDALTGEEVITFSAHKEAVRYLQYSKDGRMIMASSTDRTASIVDAFTGAPIQRFAHYAGGDGVSRRVIVNGIQLIEDDSIAVTCGYDGFVKYWDVKTGALIQSRDYHSGAQVSEVQISPDGRIMTSVGYDGSTKLIDPKTGAALANFRLDTVPMIRAAFSRDMKIVAIIHSNGRVSLWKPPMTSSDTSDSFWSILPCEAVAPRND